MIKIVLAMILFLSMPLVLTPSVIALIDSQNALSEYDGLSSSYLSSSELYQSFVAVRDNLIMQILGFILLYLFLGLGLYYYKPTNSQTESAQPNEPKKPQGTESKLQVNQTPTVKHKTSGWVYFISGLVFVGIFIWQYIDIYTNGNHNVIMSAIAPIFYGTIASIVVGLILYGITKHKIIEIEHSSLK